MKVSKEGEWMVTTPIYAGPEPEVAKATKCEHKEFKEFTRSVEPGAGLLTLAEKCAACIAVRARYRKASAEEIADFKTKQAEAAKNRQKST